MWRLATAATAAAATPAAATAAAATAAAVAAIAASAASAAAAVAAVAHRPRPAGVERGRRTPSNLNTARHRRAQYARQGRQKEIQVGNPPLCSQVSRLDAFERSELYGLQPEGELYRAVPAAVKGLLLEACDERFIGAPSVGQPYDRNLWLKLNKL